MVLIDLSQVLGSLGLVSSIAKPIPVVGPVLGGVIDTVGGIANSTLPSVVGPLDGLLGGGVISASADVAPSGDNSSELTSSSPSSSGEGQNSTVVVHAADSGNGNCAMSPYSPPEPVHLESFPAYDANQALIYRYRQQQSVNLGSWFVQEQWMVPSLFTCAAGNKQAELDIANGWGSVDNARQVLERHWDTWITEDDFVFLSSIGINTVRLPIGYWSLGPTYCQGTPFEPVSAAYVNSWARVVRAINWAEKHGLGVLVDLHGASGSQNGQGHGGTSDGVQNLFDNPTNVQLTLNVLTYLVQQLVKVNNVVGIQLLNEPQNVQGLPAFYTQALTKLRQVAPEAASFPFYIHDGFDLKRFADYISTRSDFVVVDHHSYFVFGDPASQSTPASDLTSALQPAQGSVSEELLGASSEGRRNIVVDEWSCALSEQALQGSPDAVADRQRFCTGQMESYTNATAGWSFWSYKTENCDDDVNWCFKSAIGKSLPQTFFSYPQAAVQQLASLMGDGASDSDAAAAAGNTQWLTIGSPVATSSENGYRPPTQDDWLAAMGASAPQYVGVTEALAHTDYDLKIMSPDAPAVEKGDSLPGHGPNTVASPSASPSTPATSSTSAVFSNTAAAPAFSAPAPPLIASYVDNQAPFAAAPAAPPAAAAADVTYSDDPMLNTATIPSSRMEWAESNQKRSLDILPERVFLLASNMRRHRFAARHLRRRESAMSMHHHKRQDPPSSEQPIDTGSPQQNAITRGYSDGWRAAKTFAAAGGSRLGFSGQFINDALTALGSEVMSGDAAYYRTWFLKGLADGEVQVLKSKALDSQGPQGSA